MTGRQKRPQRGLQPASGSEFASIKAFDACADRQTQTLCADLAAKSRRPSLAAALPVVLDALAAAASRDKVRTALLALLEDDAPAYRRRLAELLLGHDSRGRLRLVEPVKT